jgi:hypothetical protein
LGVSVIMDIVYSKRAFSQPLDLSGWNSFHEYPYE